MKGLIPIINFFKPKPVPVGLEVKDNENGKVTFKEVQKTTFVNGDGSGTVVITQDPRTGKFSVATTGDIDVKEGVASGELYIDGDLCTDITVDGNLTVTGNVDGNVTITGSLKYGGKIFSGKEIKQNNSMDNAKYDIEVKNGTIKFVGSLLKSNYDSENSGFFLDGFVKTEDRSRTRLNVPLYINTNKDCALLHCGDIFTVGMGSKLSAMSTNSIGIGIKCDCCGDNREFIVDNGVEVEAYGKGYGVIINESSKFTIKPDGFLTAVGNNGIFNKGTFYVDTDGYLDVDAFNYGFINASPSGNFIVDDNGYAELSGQYAGLANIVYESDKLKDASITRKTTIHIRDGATVDTIGISYTLDNENKDDNKKEDSKPENPYIIVDGEMNVTCIARGSNKFKQETLAHTTGGRLYVDYIDKRVLPPHVVVSGSGKVFWNGVLDYDGKSVVEDNNEND